MKQDGPGQRANAVNPGPNHLGEWLWQMLRRAQPIVELTPSGARHVGLTKPLTDFYPRRPTGHQGYCKMCSKAARAQHSADRVANDREYAEQRRAYIREWHRVPDNKLRSRARRYGLSRQEYDEKVKSQNGLCAICRRDLPLQVDHDHDCCATESRSCGKCNRGLLCNHCNSGIGRFEDDPQRLAAAVQYLVTWKEEHSCLK